MYRRFHLLPAGPEGGLLLTVTYAAVVFAILVQGLTILPVLRPAVADQPEPE